MTRLVAGMAGCLVALSISTVLADDSTISEQLSSELQTAKQTKELQGFRINCKVEDGVVWMTGQVKDASQKSRALDIARRVEGVRLVVNGLNLEGESLASSESVGFVQNASSGADQGAESLASAQSNAGTVAAATGANAGLDAGVMRAAAELNAAKAQTAKLQMQAAKLQMARNRVLENQIVAQRVQLAKQVNQSRNQQASFCGDGGCGIGGGVDMGGGSYAGEVVYGGDAGYGGGGYGGGATYESAQMPGYAWPSYSSYPNYASLSYPKQYSAQAWPYIGPFYPYPQVPLGWRKVSLEWDDGWWMLDFASK